MRMSDPDLITFEGCPGDGRHCEIERLFSVAALRCSGVDNSEDLFHAGKQSIHRPEPQITRQWMSPDGKFTDMKPGEYNPEWVGKNA